MPLHCLLEMDVSRRSELEGEWVLVLLECLESIDGIVHQLCSCDFRVGKKTWAPKSSSRAAGTRGSGYGSFTIWEFSMR